MFNGEVLVISQEHLQRFTPQLQAPNPGRSEFTTRCLILSIVTQPELGDLVEVIPLEDKT